MTRSGTQLWAGLSRTSPYLLVLVFSILFHLSTVDAATYYTIVAPTSSARWVAGQPGLVSLVSTEKATATTPPTARLLTITLRTYDNIFSSPIVATITDRLQLLIPYNSTATQVSTDISDWIVPLTLKAGTNYFVELDVTPAGSWDIFPEQEKSPQFQIIAAANTTIPTPSATPTATTATSTTPALPTPTTASCNDIQEQCAAQGTVFQNATATAPCSCGAPLIIPTIVPSGAIRSMTSSYAALTVLLLGALLLF